MPQVLIALISIAGPLIVIIIEVVRGYLKRNEESQSETGDRLWDLIESLHGAISSIAEIEKELGEKSKLVDKLRQDTSRYEELVLLNKPEVDAIAHVLRLELKKEGRSSFWKGIAVNSAFFVLGAGVSYAISLYAA